MDAPGAMEVVTLERAREVFADLGAQDDLVFAYVGEGCHARAHSMVQRLLLLGITPRKVWTFARAKADPLWVHPPARPESVVVWGFHVAPTIRVVCADATIRDLVLDPSLFDEPVTVDEWGNAQHDTPHVVHTALGEPPVAAKGGSGYWPAPDPPEGPDAHARETMKECREQFQEGF